jgi:hypothetical protein
LKNKEIKLKKDSIYFCAFCKKPLMRCNKDKFQGDIFDVEDIKFLFKGEHNLSLCFYCKAPLFPHIFELNNWLFENSLDFIL